MELFKTNKKQPIKFTNFKYIGTAENHPHVCFYYKELMRDNYELMTCVLESSGKKLEIGAGTNVKVLDAFMSNYLYNMKNEREYKDTHSFVESVINNSFADLKEEQKEAMIKKYNSCVPQEIKKFDSYKKLKKDGYKLLYCSNDESKDRAFGVVNIVMVKDFKIDSKDERFNIHSAYTYFKPLKFFVSPAYIKKISNDKYIEEPIGEIVVDNIILK